MTRGVMVLLAVMVAAAVQAEPMDGRMLPADTRWYAHIDMTKLMGTEAGRLIRDQWAALPDSRRKLAEVKMITGMDPWTDLRSVTVFGPVAGDAEAVAVIRADADPATLENVLALAQDYNAMTHAGRTVHIWTPDDGKHDTMALCVADPGTYVVGASPQRVKAAVDALDKAATAAPLPLVENVAADRWLEMAVSGLDTLEGVEDRKPWMSQIRDLRASVGSDAGQMMMTVSGVMSDAQVAERSRTMLEGFKAMAELRVAEVQPEAAALIANISVQSEGARVWLDASCPLDQLRTMIQQRQRPTEGGEASPTGEGKPSLTAPLGHMLEL